MCGRLNVTDNEGVRLLLAMLGMDTWPEQLPNYNIPPTLSLGVVQQQDDLVAAQMNWGVSMNMKGKSGKLITKRIPNARSDKVWSSPLWRKLIGTQRVLVPINGFYEWKRKNKKLEAAYYITPSHGAAMLLAGIYHVPKDSAESPEVALITTEANAAMSAVHDRMPVLLSSQNEAMAWLQDDDRATLSELMQPASNDALVFSEVSDYVNSTRNHGPRCIEPLVA